MRDASKAARKPAKKSLAHAFQKRTHGGMLSRLGEGALALSQLMHVSYSTLLRKDSLVHDCHQSRHRGPGSLLGPVFFALHAQITCVVIKKVSKTLTGVNDKRLHGRYLLARVTGVCLVASSVVLRLS